MKKRYTAVSQITGETFKRTTESRTYTHAVVHHVAARPANEFWPDRPAYAHAEWRGSLRLAEQCANGWRGKANVIAVEILSAAEVIR